MKSIYKMINEILDSSGYHLFEMMIYHELVFFNQNENNALDDETLEKLCVEIYDTYLDSDVLICESPSTLAQVGLEMYLDCESKELFEINRSEFEDKVIYLNYHS